MDVSELLSLRLANQRLQGQLFANPVEMVRWFGIVQSQDYSGAAWAVSQRVQASTEVAFSISFARGEIIRTHLFRPTWHFVLPEDSGWMLDLARPQMLKAGRSQWRALELEEAVFERSNEIIVRALESERHLTRQALANHLEAAGVIVGNGVRLAHLMARAEVEGLICSGPPQGKQQTYTLLKRSGPTYAREEALAHLALRYFVSHGPATLRDFSWWSGLGMTNARMGLEAISSQLVHEKSGEDDYWFASSPVSELKSTIHLLPNYDEYVVSYTNRSMLFDTTHKTKLDSRQNPLFNNLIIINGRIGGTWKRVIKKTSVVIQPTFFLPPSAYEVEYFAAVVDRYGSYLGLPASVMVDAY